MIDIIKNYLLDRIFRLKILGIEDKKRWYKIVFKKSLIIYWMEILNWGKIMQETHLHCIKNSATWWGTNPYSPGPSWLALKICKWYEEVIETLAAPKKNVSQKHQLSPVFSHWINDKTLTYKLLGCKRNYQKSTFGLRERWYYYILFSVWCENKHR